MLLQDREVSIHAPAWGATMMRLLLLDFGSFNPRPRVGGDPAASRFSSCNGYAFWHRLRNLENVRLLCIAMEITFAPLG